ncbi:MAG: hypothetical protein ABR875_00535 [Minisyncoccia bacterium]|jgi:hypothetical protein
MFIVHILEDFMIISPCNGLRKCWRHPGGCARIVIDPRDEYATRMRNKARRRRLWHIVLEQYRICKKWRLNPIPPELHLQVVLLLEQVQMETEQRFLEKEQGKSNG